MESVMSVEFKNYYDVLGVPRSASDEEIRRAFRTLARKYHPDVARDKSGADRRFKEINEANEVLSDPAKRRKYDELGANWNHPEREEARRQGGFGRAPESGEEFHFDGTGFSDFFEQFFGSRGRPAGGFGPSWEEGAEARADAQRGQDVEGDILVTLDEVLLGSARTIRLGRTDPHTGRSASQTLRVRIPPGVRESQLIRLTGKGQEGSNGGASGNLYLRVKFAKHPDFRVQGANLYHDLELSPWEAVLGTTVRIPTLDGMVSLKIPPGTTAERELRLHGKGLPTGAGTRGDLHAIVSIQVPSRLTPEQKVLWEQLAAKSTFSPRSAS
jgi:curved DNA-binding protein